MSDDADRPQGAVADDGSQTAGLEVKADDAVVVADPTPPAMYPDARRIVARSLDGTGARAALRVAQTELGMIIVDDAGKRRGLDGRFVTRT